MAKKQKRCLSERILFTTLEGNLRKSNFTPSKDKGYLFGLVILRLRLIGELIIFDSHIKEAAAAFVLRNVEAQLIGVGVLNLDGVTISVDEAMTLRECLRYARHRGIKNIIVEGDSKLIIQSVQEIWDAP
ncbi:hypothetical protein ACFXTH_027045 [Malus domestica]